MKNKKGAAMNRKNDNTGHETPEKPTKLELVVPEDLRIDEESTFEIGEMPFKKMLWGLNPKEVNDYIEALNANLTSAQRVFDEQSEELKSNLTFIMRERDNLKAELAIVMDKAGAHKQMNVEYEQKSADYEQGLQELETIKTELAAMTDKAEEYEQKNAEYERNKRELETTKYELAVMTDKAEAYEQMNAEYEKNIEELGTIKSELIVMTDKAKEYEQQITEYEQRLQELEKIKSELVAMADRAKEYERQNAVHEESIRELSAENREHRKKIARIETERNRLEEQSALLVAEIAGLREENIKQAYDFAQQKKDIETQFINEKLQRAELMQLYTYHVRKSDDLINELVKQFNMAVKALEDIEIS